MFSTLYMDLLTPEFNVKIKSNSTKVGKVVRYFFLTFLKIFFKRKFYSGIPDLQDED